MSTIPELERQLRNLLQGEHSSLTISFNEHAHNYCDAHKAVERGILGSDEWVSEEEKQRAIETNSVWSLQWYPETPVGFHSLLASSLEAVITATVA
jgi:hypothetical protein